MNCVCIDCMKEVHDTLQGFINLDAISHQESLNSKKKLTQHN